MWLVQLLPEDINPKKKKKKKKRMDLPEIREEKYPVDQHESLADLLSPRYRHTQSFRFLGEEKTKEIIVFRCVPKPKTYPNVAMALTQALGFAAHTTQSLRYQPSCTVPLGADQAKAQEIKAQPLNQLA